MSAAGGKALGFKKKPFDQSIGLRIGSDPAILESWQSQSQQHGVKIVSLCAGSLNKCQIWDKDRELAMRIAKQTIDGCHTLGVHVMLFPFFGPSNFQTDDAALEGVAGFMKELLPYAQEKNVVIGIEAPLTTVRVLELMEKLSFPENLKIYYDTGNLFAKEDIYQTIRNYGQQHFCEVHIKAAGNAVAGQGQMDLAKLASALDEAKYDKWLVYEANRNGKEPVANRQAIEKIVTLRRSKAKEPTDDQQPGEFRDDFADSELAGREIVSSRGGWSFDNNTATAVCDLELYAKHKNHGPILKWPVEFNQGNIEFEMKASDCQRVVFTLNGEGHIFRVTLADETDACKAGRSKVPTRMIAWSTQSSKQNKGDTIKPDGMPDLPAIQNQWVRFSLDIDGERARVAIGEFKTELKHVALARDKSNITLTFAHGELSIRNYRMKVK